ncbi:MAG TPA: PGF-pre-PGF domain-containing protein [Candidatus Methanomethylicus sp.]|nr:PGF-pre-PGF domain-containing protein [Candidatus Methanomethylicus sp.]
MAVLMLSLFSFVPTPLAAKTAGPLGYSILVYTDDPQHSVGDNGPIVALDGMGYNYTCFYADQYSFLKALEAGHWDLVICNEENYHLESEVFDAMYAHVQSGGKLILCTWIMHQCPSHPLWSSMGISYAATVYSGAWQLYPWQANHVLLNAPNALNTTLYYEYYGYGIYGFYVDALPGATALFGVTPSESANCAVIVLNQAKGTIFNGLLTSIMSSDSDADGIRDDVELLENEIAYLLDGVTPSTRAGQMYAPPVEPTLTSGFECAAFVDVLGNRLNDYALGSDNSAMAFYGLQVDSSRTFRKAQLLLDEQSISPVYPTHDALPEGVTTYTYARLLLGVPSSSIESVTVSFKVSKAWLASNGLDAADVALFRHSSGWAAQPTSLVSEDDGFAYYSAAPSGLTYLAIGA